MQEQSFLSAFARQPWRNFKNTSGVTFPAWGIGRIMDYAIVNGEIEFRLGRPNSSAQEIYLVNGPTDVSVDGPGVCTNLMHGGNLLVDLTSGTPAVGQAWGAQDGFFSAKLGNRGFLVTGAHVGSTPRAHVAALQIPQPPQRFAHGLGVDNGPTSSGLFDFANVGSATVLDVGGVARANPANQKQIEILLEGTNWYDLSFHVQGTTNFGIDAEVILFLVSSGAQIIRANARGFGNLSLDGRRFYQLTDGDMLTAQWSQLIAASQIFVQIKPL